jgi:hypothetical protein
VVVRLILLLTAVLDDGEWSASRPGGFTPGERASHYPPTVAGWSTELVWTLRHLYYTVLSQVDCRKYTNQNVAVTTNFSLLKRNVHPKYVCSDRNDEALSSK